MIKIVQLVKREKRDNLKKIGFSAKYRLQKWKEKRHCDIKTQIIPMNYQFLLFFVFIRSD